MMVTINEDEVVGFIMREINGSLDETLDLTYRKVRAVLDAEHEFLRSKGLVEEREDAAVYVSDGNEIISLDVDDIGAFHNTGTQHVTYDEDDGDLVFSTPHSFIRRDYCSRARDSIVGKEYHGFRMTYGDTTSIRGELLFSSVEANKFVMQVIRLY